MREQRDRDATESSDRKSQSRSNDLSVAGSQTSAVPESAAHVLHLQRTVGNAAVARAIDVARHSRGTPDDDVQRSSVQGVLRSPGRPLDTPVRADMETRLGADFSDVRLHTGFTAQRSAAEIGASAYTSGNHVVLGSSGADKHTLAHELTHVIQQRSDPVSGTDNGNGLKISDPSDHFEREAEANATRAMRAGTSSGATVCGDSNGTDQAQHSYRGRPNSVQRVEYMKQISGEVDRLRAQLEPYVADYTSWWSNQSDQKYSTPDENGEYLGDAMEAVKNYLHDPEQRSIQQLKADLTSAIEADLRQASKETFEDSRGSARAAKNKLVLGRVGDTSKWRDNQRKKSEKSDRTPEESRVKRVLNTGKWSVPVNYAFVDGGIEERANFKIITSLGSNIEGMLTSGKCDVNNFWDNVAKQGSSALWDTNKTAEEGGSETMLGHEIVQLLKADYRFHLRPSKAANDEDRIVAIHSSKSIADPGDKTIPLP